MLKVGLTGGIGSGKTTVAKIFELLGIPVYYADDAAKLIMQEDPKLRTAIQKQFGEEAYKDNELNREFLAAKVFSDPLELEKLNAIVHPATIEHANRWMQQQETPYTIKEAALIFEAGANKHLDYVIGVHAPVSLSIKRTIERNNISEEEVLKRMEKQLDEETKMKLCDFVLVNDEKEMLIPQVIKVHEQLIKLSSDNR